MENGGRYCREWQEIVGENGRISCCGELAEYPCRGSKLGWVGSEGTKGGKGEELDSEVCVQKVCATSTQSDLPLSPHFAKRVVQVLQAWPLPWERLCCSVRTTHIACQSPEIAQTPTIRSVNSDSTPGSASAKSFGPVVNAPMVGRLIIGVHKGRDAEGRHYLEVQRWVE